ncbi:MAG: hypothetical protein NTW94_07570 [Legionellales bacterium]|nr:hypothetical protein [Legionellales bacterium]
MKLKLLFVVSAQVMALDASAALNCGDCTLPCGAQQLICCAAQSANTKAGTQLYASEEEFYNKILFNKENLDGFCKKPGPGTQISELQKYYFANYCKNAGDYFSYTNFMAAANTTNFTNPQSGGAFGCVGTAQVRFKELSNFLTTMAQETTSVSASIPYTNDGLYFRYENDYLLKCSTTPFGALNTLCTAPTSTPDSAPYTNYYPASTLFTDMNLSGDSYTQSLSLGNTGTVTLYNISLNPETITFGPYPYPINSGDTGPQLNDPSVLNPGLWVGMGPKQLTGQSMFEYFGWYQNNITAPAVQYANFNLFVTNYLNDGKVAFQGAFWYWMFRVNGFGYRTIHAMVTDTERPVCGDIAAVTRMVNGLCNNYNPGRLTYYEYFNKVFNILTKPVKCTTGPDANPSSTSLDSLVCAVGLQTYCQPAVSSGPCV